MKSIRINNFEEKIFYEKLENGLEVYLLPLLHKKNYLASFAVKYGGRDIKFKIEGKEYKTPAGIAHFLEHKMFERENDPFTFFEKSGTDVNASTSHDYTNYFILGSDDFIKNLEYMLEWPKKIELTEEEVEKEKGIILEEASMYKDHPMRVLNEEIKKKLFLKDPYRLKVIGSDNDIKSMSKKDIELVFNTFYTSNNMFFIIVGNFDKDEAIELIREKGKAFKPKFNVEKTYEQEPDDIDTEEKTIPFNIDVPRISVGYKFNKKLFSGLNVSRVELDLLMHFLISVALGPTSEIRETWVKQNLFLNSMYRITEIDTHYTIEFNALTKYPDKLKKELEKYLKDVKISEELFNREKKLWIANEIESISNVNSMKYNIMDDVLDYEEFIPNKIEIIKNLEYKKLEEIKELLKFDKNATVKLMPKE